MIQAPPIIADQDFDTQMTELVSLGTTKSNNNSVSSRNSKNSARGGKGSSGRGRGGGRGGYSQPGRPATDWSIRPPGQTALNFGTIITPTKAATSSVLVTPNKNIECVHDEEDEYESKTNTTTPEAKTERNKDATDYETEDKEIDDPTTTVTQDDMDIQAPTMQVNTNEEKLPSNAPLMKSILNEVASEEVNTTYITRILYRRKVKNNPNVIELLKNLCACLMQYNKTVQLLPYNEHDRSNSVITPRDIPSEVDSFGIYVPYAKVNRGNTLFMRFKIQANMPLSKIKTLKGVMSFLERCTIYLESTQLKTVDNVKIGGLLMSHCQYTCKDQANEEVSDRINDGEEVKLAIELSPHSFWYGSGGNKVSTRLLAIECSRENSNVVRERIYKKFMTIPSKHWMGNARHFRFMPFKATATLTEDAIRKGVMLQNKYLLDTAAVTLKFLSDGNWTVPGTEIQFKQMVLEATEESCGIIFTNVEPAGAFDRVHLVTTKKNLIIARAWVDEFLLQLKNMMEVDEWSDLTGYKCMPRRGDQVITSDAEKEYSALMMNQLNIGPSQSEQSERHTNAPKKQAWCKAVYGVSETVAVANSQEGVTEETISTMSQPMMSNQSSGNAANKNSYEQFMKEVEERSKRDKEEIKGDMMSKIDALENSTNKRTGQLVSIVEESKQVVTRMIKNQEGKDAEMAQCFEGIRSLHDMSRQTISMFEKLQNTMCVFMKRTAESVNGKSNNGEAPSKMVIEDLTEYLEDDQLEFITVDRKRKPSSAGTNSLRDGANKK